MQEQSSLACDLTAIDDGERPVHEEVARALLASVQDVRELPDGYALRLPTGTQTIERAGAFVARERLCCPFFHFRLEVEGNHGPVWLSMSGDRQVKQFLKDNVVAALEIDAP